MLQSLIALIIVVVSIAKVGAQPPLIGKSKEPIKGATLGARMDEIRAGRFLVDPPTLENVGFRWYVEGDSNRNARVDVDYRQRAAIFFRRVTFVTYTPKKISA